MKHIRGFVFLVYFYLFIYFSILWLHLQHLEVPGPGVGLELQVRPTPQLQQCQIWALSETCTTACSNTRSLTHWARPGIKATSSQRQHWVLYPLSHNGNSYKRVFCIFFFFFWAKIGLNWAAPNQKWLRVLHSRNCGGTYWEKVGAK